MMKMKAKVSSSITLILLSGLVGLVLSSCGEKSTITHISELVKTETSPPSSTLVPEETLFSSILLKPQPTNTPTVESYPKVVNTKAWSISDFELYKPTTMPEAMGTPIPTNTPYSYSDLPALSELIINESDFEADKYSFDFYLQIYFQIDDPEPVDATNDLVNKCEIDCVKVSWGFETLTLTMIRYKDSEVAYQAFEDEWKIYQQDDHKLEECNTLDNPNDNQWAVVLIQETRKIIFKLSSVQGPVYLSLVYPYWVKGNDVDGGYYCQALEHFSKVQLQKIRNVAIIKTP